MKDLLKEQFDKLPVSRLVMQDIPEEDRVAKDPGRFIRVNTFRTSALFPVPFYKNISRDIPLSRHEDH